MLLNNQTTFYILEEPPDGEDQMDTTGDAKNQEQEEVGWTNKKNQVRGSEQQTEHQGRVRSAMA